MSAVLHGIVAFPITPFATAGGIDDYALTLVTENLLRSTPASVSFLGSTGESAYLTEDEWRHTAKTGVQIVAGRVPVTIGICELTTSSAVAKARYAASVGADMLMVLPLSYWKLSDAEIYDYFETIAAELICQS